MAEALAHRGPDDSGVEIRGTVGMAHTRLAIVDPTSAGHQPMEDPSGRWLVTYNGEIFNHAELRGQLPSVSFRGHSDTETLVHALDAWGEAALPRLNGMFAFAALDSSGRRLLLARDRFGKKPLYLARAQGALWFASEMRALFAAGVPRRARRDVLNHSLVHGWPQGSVTPVAGIDRLLPGTLASVDLETLAMSSARWYDPAAQVDPDLSEQLARTPRSQLAELLEEALRKSVRRRLMADVPLGIMCSGGLDSSLVAALARQETTGSIAAFTGSVTGGGQLDELDWARQVAASLGVELEVVSIDAESWRPALVPAVEHFEYPLPHESAVPIAQISSAAERQGVKVLLTGEGADELFGGYPFFHQREFRRALGGPRLSPRGLVAGLANGYRTRPRELPTAPDVISFEHDVDQSAAGAYAHHRGARGKLEAGLLGDLSRNALPFLLNRMDKNAMQASVETRVPFLDPHVVSLALNLPLEHRVGLERKSLLRAVAARHLPAELAARPKQVGLELDSGRWFEGAARPGFLWDGSLREVLGVPAERWRSRLSRLTGNQGMAAWTGEIWCRLALEGSAPSAVESELWL
jgi:asparagine synthase (glutamine-hydrolysing)